MIGDLYQYQISAAPLVEPTPEVFLNQWFRQASEPTRRRFVPQPDTGGSTVEPIGLDRYGGFMPRSRYVWQYQAFTRSLDLSTNPLETLTVDKWYKQQPDPVRRIRASQPTVGEPVFTEVFQIAVAIAVGFNKRGIHWQYQAIARPITISEAAAGWTPLPSVLLEGGAGEDITFNYQAIAEPFQEEVALDKWYRQPPEPRRRPRTIIPPDGVDVVLPIPNQIHGGHTPRHPPFNYQALATPISYTAAVAPDIATWFQQQPDPRRRPKPIVLPDGVETVEPIPNRVEGASPPRHERFNYQAFVRPLFFDGLVAAEMNWFLQSPDPVRRPKRVIQTDEVDVNLTRRRGPQSMWHHLHGSNR
jgi:hypothetical protein